MKLLKVGTLALAATTLVGGSANAATILVFGQTATGGSIVATNGAAGNGATTITATNLGVDITLIEGGAPTLTPTFLNLSATSVGQATVSGGGTVEQQFNGTFSITASGVNYLSGSFTAAFVTGANGSTGLTFNANQPPNGLTFSSDVITTLGTPRSMSLGFTNVSQPVAAIDVDPSGAVYNTIRAFTSNVAGTFSADAPQVPEPATMTILGLGLLGAAVRGRRRR